MRNEAKATRVVSSQFSVLRGALPADAGAKRSQAREESSVLGIQLSRTRVSCRLPCEPSAPAVPRPRKIRDEANAERLSATSVCIPASPWAVPRSMEGDPGRKTKPKATNSVNSTIRTQPPTWIVASPGAPPKSAKRSQTPPKITVASPQSSDVSPDGARAPKPTSQPASRKTKERNEANTRPGHNLTTAGMPSSLCPSVPSSPRPCPFPSVPRFIPNEPTAKPKAKRPHQPESPHSWPPPSCLRASVPSCVRASFFPNEPTNRPSPPSNVKKISTRRVYVRTPPSPSTCDEPAACSPPHPRAAGSAFIGPDQYCRRTRRRCQRCA